MYKREKFFKHEPWNEFVIDAFETGSRYICDPPVLDTDEDFIALVDGGNLRGLEVFLVNDGWSLGGSPGSKDEYKWYRDLGYVALREYRDAEGWIYVRYVRADGSLDREIDPDFVLDFVLDFEEKFDEPFKIDPNKLKKLEEFPVDFSGEHVFRSWKKDDQNLIVTCSSEYFDNFWKATKLATFLNLKEKTDRVAVFQAICRDNWSFNKYEKKEQRFFGGNVEPAQWPAPQFVFDPLWDPPAPLWGVGAAGGANGILFQQPQNNVIIQAQNFVNDLGVFGQAQNDGMNW